MIQPAETREDAATARTRHALRRYADAWLAGDRDALAACYHDEFTLYYGGNNALSGIHAGRTKALTVLAEFSRRTRRKLVTIVDVMAGPERGALLVREQFRREGATAEFERLLVYAVADGLLRECWVYDQDPAAIDMYLA